MGFILSFLIIITAGFWSYALYHRFGLSKGRRGWLAWYAFIIVGGLMVFDTLAYLGFLDFIFPIISPYLLVDIENGRDFMWNFLFFGIKWNIEYDSPGLGLIAILLILSYPMWFKFWSNGSGMLFGGNKPYMVGTWHLLAPTKKPKEDEDYAKPPEKT